ncbi:hypothetical protein TBK1r_12700 [Stieleria magnilauensis]|uniref:Uncharacterized protein n=1 Tax=Stieleria magnilauensis TaxID=2527963 RepID=A0ABX5XLT0_9BACT|nr:hypothetical protein TBK1r_12700 [Planctomycetes bacterium TBK1r]
MSSISHVVVCQTGAATGNAPWRMTSPPAMNAGAGLIDPAIFAQLAVASVAESTSGPCKRKTRDKEFPPIEHQFPGFKLISGGPGRCDVES